MRAGIGLVCTALACVVAVACGGGGETETAAPGSPEATAYGERMDELCVETVRRLREIGPPIRRAEEARVVAESNEMRRELLARFEDLAPPDEVADAHAAHVEARAAVLAANERYAEALDGSDDEVAAADEERSQADADVFATAAKLPGSECDGEPTAEQAAAIEELVEIVETSDDGTTLCTEHLSEEFVGTAFGGSVEKCERFQEGYEPAESTEVSDIIVVGPFGSANSRPRGGDSQAGTFIVSQRDGRWSADQILVPGGTD